MAGLAGIEHRWSFLEPVDDDDFEAADREGFYRLGAFPGTAQRMERFETQGVKLCEEAVRALGENEDVQSATHLLLVSCTGFVAPGIDQMSSEERRVGKEGVSTCRSRGSPYL